jgi:hypothetical protein
MDAAGNELADRVRALLSADAEIEERRMFGTRAFLDDGRILVGARPAEFFSSASTTRAAPLS